MQNIAEKLIEVALTTFMLLVVVGGTCVVLTRKYK
jgi:hypothetical protein